MRADWAISRPSVRVCYSQEYYAKLSLIIYVHATVKKKVHFLCLKHLVGLVMAWVSILRKKSFSTTYKGNIACQPQQRYWSNYIYIESRITKMRIGGIFSNWMILIRLWKGIYTTQNVPVSYCDQKSKNAPFSSANQTRSMIANSSIWYNNIDNILTWQKTSTLFDSLRKKGHFYFPVFFMVEYY